MIKRGNKAVAQYLIKWADLAYDFATWESATDLRARFPSFTFEDKDVVHRERGWYSYQKKSLKRN